MLPHLIGRNTCKWHVDNVALGVESERLDQRSLARAGRTIKHQPQLVRIPLDRVLPYRENAWRNNKSRSSVERISNPLKRSAFAPLEGKKP